MQTHLLRIAFVIITSVVVSYTSAQDRSLSYDSVSKLVQAAYNTQDPANMYALTSSAYQNRMSAVKFTEGTNKFYAKAGKWLDMKAKVSTDSSMVYTVRFEKLTQLFSLQLDKEDKISRFDFKAMPIVKGTKNYPVQSNNPLRTSTDSLVEKLVRPYIQQSHTTGLVVAILKNGKIYRYSYGETKKRSNSLPDPKKTIFEIGSVTKTFTSLLLAREVVQKNMQLHDPINKYLPNFIPPLRYQTTAITLQHLANHTSGFPRLPDNIFKGNVNPVDPYRHYGKDSLYRFLQTYQPTSLPGTRFSYSNFGAGVLGCILAQKAKMSFEQLIVAKICHPLQMKDTRIELTPKDSVRFAQGYNESGEPTAPWNLASLQGSGAIRSTLNDMIRYTQAQLGQLHTSLDKAILLTHQITFRSSDNTMALGWRVKQLNDQIYWHHSGGTGGFRSFVGFVKDRQLGVVILSNTAEEVTAIGQAFLETK